MRPTYLTTVLLRHLDQRRDGDCPHRFTRKFFYDIITEADVTGRGKGMSFKQIWGEANTTDKRMAYLSNNLSSYLFRNGVDEEALGLEAHPAGESYGADGGRHHWTEDTPIDLPIVLIVEKRTIAPDLAAAMRRHGVKVVTTQGGAKSSHLAAVARYRAMGIPVFVMSDEDVGGWQSTKSLEAAGAVRITLADLEKATGRKVPPIYILEDTSMVNQPYLQQKLAAKDPEFLARLVEYGKRTGLPHGRIEMEGEENTFGGSEGYAAAISGVIRSKVGDVDHRAALAARLESDPDLFLGGVFARLKAAIVKSARARIMAAPIRAPPDADMAAHINALRVGFEKQLPRRVLQALRVIEEWLRE